MTAVETALLAVSVGGHLLLLAGTVWSLARPERRIWPPPGRDSWEFTFTWILFAVATAAFIALGLLDWSALSLPAGLRYGVGGTLVAGGLGLASWGIVSLGFEQALGLEGELATRGPYRFTRNPQYLGDLAATLGWMLLTASPAVAVAGSPALVWYLLLPRTEEPWLEKKLGGAYRRYADRVPRFLGRPRKKPPRDAEPNEQSDTPKE